MHENCNFINDSIPAFILKASLDPGTMYYYQAMRQENRMDLKEAMHKEINNQIANSNFTVINYSKVLPNTQVLSAVWKINASAVHLQAK